MGMLFLARFQLYAGSIELVFLYTIDVTAFHFSSTVPSGILASLSFNGASRSSLPLLILIVLIANFLIGILSFLILHLICILVVDLIIT